MCGKTFPFRALLKATGAEPITLTVPGAADSQLYYVRTFADSRVIEKAASAKRAVVVGASFIGLKVAASLRARGLDVHVVAPEQLPLEHVLGSEVGRFMHASPSSRCDLPLRRDGHSARWTKGDSQ